MNQCMEKCKGIEPCLDQYPLEMPKCIYSPAIAPTETGEQILKNERETIPVCSLSQTEKKRNLDLEHLYFEYIKYQFNSILKQLEEIGVYIFDHENFSKNEGYALSCVYYSTDADKLLFDTKHVNLGVDDDE